MIKFFLIHLILQGTFKFVWCNPTLDQRNAQTELDPLLDASSNIPKKEHDKRTIFSSRIQNYGWAKHIGHHPSGFRYVLGYGPVDLKYVPVLRQPIKLFSHIHSPRYRWPSKFVKPLLPVRHIHDHGWKPSTQVVKPAVVKPVIQVVPVANPIVKPVIPIVKPVVPVVKPVFPIVAPAPQWPDKSCHDEWKQKPVYVNPVAPLNPVNVVHFQPALKPFPPPQLLPAPPPVAPVFPIRPIVPVQQFVPAQPVAPAHPVVVSNPWIPSVKPAYPLVPHQHFFEVSRPNLPVLPLGATFPSPVLQQVPTGPGVIVQKPTLIHQNPGPVVEYHGTHNVVPVNGFINFNKLASIQPQYAPQFLQNHHPSPSPSFIQSPGVQIQQNPVPTFVPQLSGTQPTVQFPQTQQQLPQVTSFQQLPQQSTDEQYQPPLAHGQLPLEGENQSTAQDTTFISSNGQNFLPQQQDNQYYPQNDVQQEQFQSSNSIQPGQTDVQTPLYLPPHNVFNPQVESFNGFNSQLPPLQGDGFNDFRPSPTLEPPFNNLAYNRREDIGIQEEGDIETQEDDHYSGDQTKNNLN